MDSTNQEINNALMMLSENGIVSEFEVCSLGCEPFRKCLIERAKQIYAEGIHILGYKCMKCGWMYVIFNTDKYLPDDAKRYVQEQAKERSI